MANLFNQFPIWSLLARYPIRADTPHTHSYPIYVCFTKYLRVHVLNNNNNLQQQQQ